MPGRAAPRPRCLRGAGRAPRTPAAAPRARRTAPRRRPRATRAAPVSHPVNGSGPQRVSGAAQPAQIDWLAVRAWIESGLAVRGSRTWLAVGLESADGVAANGRRPGRRSPCAARPCAAVVVEAPSEQRAARGHVIAERGEDLVVLRLRPQHVGGVARDDLAAREVRQREEGDLARRDGAQRLSQVVQAGDPAELAVDRQRLGERVEEPVDGERVVAARSAPG